MTAANQTASAHLSGHCYDRLVRSVRLVRPGADQTPTVDIAIKDGTFAAIEASLPPSTAAQIIDGTGLLAFPGLVDAHMHLGIYRPLEQDAVSESKAAASGGVTSMLTYMRTGQYYLNQGGPYREVYPRVLDLSKDNYYVDYGYHLAPINRGHIDEMELLLREFGVASFKIFMFYGGHGLHGRSSEQSDFLLLEPGERYDIAHFEFIMRELSRIIAEVPEASEHVSLSLHCELADILAAYTRLVEHDRSLSGLRAYSASRPPHSEGLAIFLAAYLANETNCPNINLLHLSSGKAMDAARTMRQIFPHIDFRREVTVGHLLLDVDAPAAGHAKVNPPIRPREDVERLWDAVLAGDVDWIVSDHACCSADQKLDPAAPDDIFAAKSGFGGTEHLLSGVMTEGRRRGMSYGHMAELLSGGPARRFGLRSKGDIAVGFDADLALVDPAESFVVRAGESPSRQGYTPFAGMELSGRVKYTLVRGEVVYENGVFPGQPCGQYLRRPYGPRRERGQ
jgi:allantoinase